MNHYQRMLDAAFPTRLARKRRHSWWRNLLGMNRKIR